MIKMRIRQRLASNTTYLALNWIFATMFSVVFWTILGKALNPSSYGVVSVFFQISTLLSGFCLVGLGSTVNKLVPEFLQGGRMDKVQGILSFSFKFTIAVSLLVALIVFAFSKQLAPVLKLRDDVMIFTAVSALIMTPVSLFDYVYYGFQNMKKQFATNFVGGLTKVVLAGGFVTMGMGYIGAVIALLASEFVTLLVRLEKKVFTLSKTSVVDMKKIVSFSAPALVVFISTTILSESQYVMLSALKTTTDVGLMSIGMKIPSIIGVVPVIFFTSLAPIVSGLSISKNAKPRQSYLVKIVFRYTLFCIVPMSAFLILFSKYAILLFATSEYLSAINLLAVLTVAIAIQGLSGFLLTNLYSIGEPKKCMYLQVISSVLYLVMSITMTYYFSTMGMAVAYLVSNLFLFAISFYYLSRHLSFSMPLSDVARIAIATAVSVVLIVLAMPYINNFVVAIAAAVLAGGVYALVLLPMNFYITEDISALDMIAGKVPIVSWVVGITKRTASRFIRRSYKEIVFGKK